MAVGPRKYFDGFGLGSHVLLSLCPIATEGASIALINKQIMNNLSLIAVGFLIYETKVNQKMNKINENEQNITNRLFALFSLIILFAVDIE